MSELLESMPSHPPFLTATILSVPSVSHGFFTRQGGTSEGLYASLNTGLGSKDDQNRIIENRRRVAAAFNLPLEALVTCYQIHSNKVVTVDKAWTPTNAPQADGMVTNKPDVILAILAADCVPVLFADTHAGVIGACHAGWKGALSGILEATIWAMVALGAIPPTCCCGRWPCNW
ncbi:MAG: polyphenol oxidase family protein [Alphaproteobacteria bacterium]